MNKKNKKKLFPVFAPMNCNYSEELFLPVITEEKVITKKAPTKEIRAEKSPVKEIFYPEGTTVKKEVFHPNPEIEIEQIDI